MAKETYKIVKTSGPKLADNRKAEFTFEIIDPVTQYGTGRYVTITADRLDAFHALGNYTLTIDEE